MTARDRAREDLFRFHKCLYTGRFAEANEIAKRYRLNGLDPREISDALEAASRGYVMPADECMEGTE